MKSALLFITVAALTGCMSIARTDTNRDQTFGDPVAKIAEGSLTAEQAATLQGKTLNGPEISLFGGNLSLGIFRWAKGQTEQYNGSMFNHGSAAFSKSAASGIQSNTKYRRGKEHSFGAAEVTSEAHTKDFFAGVSDVGRVWLASTPAGQALLAKSAIGDNITKADMDTVITDPQIPANVRTELEELKATTSN